MNLSELPVLQKVYDHTAIPTSKNIIRLTNVTIDIALPEGVQPVSDEVDLWLNDASGRLIRITGTRSPLPEKEQDTFEFQLRDRTSGMN
jgi:hypothetical protein